MGGRAAPRPTRAVLLAVSAETALALVLGFAHLGDRSFWQDEAFTWSTVDRSLPDLLGILVSREGFQILHSLLVWPVDGLWSSVVALRAPSVLAFAATVPAVWLLGRRLYGEATGLTAGLLLALNAFALRYAQEARSYTLAMMFTAFAGAALVRHVEAPSRSTRACWVTLSALAVYSHGFAVLAVGAQVLSLTLLPADRARVLRPWRSGAWIALWAAPALVLPLAQVRSGDTSWIGKPGLAAFVSIVWSISGRTITTVAPYLLAAAVAVVAARREAAGEVRSMATWRAALLLAWAVGPVAVLWAASYLSPVWLERYALWSLGAVVVLVARGLALIPRRWWREAVVLAVALLATRGVLRWYDEPAQGDYDAAVSFVAARVRPGDAVLSSPDEARIPFEFYARDSAITRDATPVYPPDPWREFKTGDQTAETVGLVDVRRAAGYDRVWVVLFDQPGVAYARVSILLADHRVVAHRGFEGPIEVLLFERR